jgi:hypothetical protein
MDAHNPPPVFASPPVLAGRSAGASSGTPSFDTPLVLPHKPEAARVGRFFELRLLPTGVWRCILKTPADGVVSFRDFGITDEDYLRAWDYGNEWANS